MTINQLDLTTHSSWASFSSSSGFRNLIYNISFLPDDPSLFQNGMTGVLGINRINCSDYIDNPNINLQVITISTYWIQFEISSVGSTVFNALIIDILIISQAFRGNISSVYVTYRLSWVDSDISKSVPN